MISINTNVASLNLLNSYRAEVKNFSSIVTRLVTGQKVNKAADAPATFVQLSHLSNDLASMQGIQTTVQENINFVAVAEKSTNEIIQTIEKIKNLAISASTGTMSEELRAKTQESINDLSENIVNTLNNSSLASGTSMGVNVFGLTKDDIQAMFDAIKNKSSDTINSGAKSYDLLIGVNNGKCSYLEYEASLVNDYNFYFDVSTQENARATIDKIETLIGKEDDNVISLKGSIVEKAAYIKMIGNSLKESTLVQVNKQIESLSTAIESMNAIDEVEEEENYTASITKLQNAESLYYQSLVLQRNVVNTLLFGYQGV